MKLNYWDVSLLLTSPAGNRYDHTETVKAGTMSAAKVLAVTQFVARNPGYTALARGAYRGGAVDAVREPTMTVSLKNGLLNVAVTGGAK